MLQDKKQAGLVEAIFGGCVKQAWKPLFVLFRSHVEPGWGTYIQNP